MKTIICENYQKEDVYHRLQTASGAPGITGIRLISPGALLRCEEHEDTERTMLQCAHLLQENESRFPVYRAMFRYPDFILEILSFARECILWGITPDDLPQRTAAESELRGILSLVFTLDLQEKRTAARYDELIANAAQGETEILPMFVTDPYKRRFLHTLAASSPGITVRSWQKNCRTESLYYALSTRQELEACAQQICADSKPCTIVLCSYEEQLPVLQQVFSRYGIPYTPYKHSVHVRMPAAFCALAELAEKKDGESLLAALQADAFPVPFDETLYPYLQETLTSASCPAPVSELLSFYKKDAARFAVYEKAAAEAFARIQNELELLVSSAAPKEVLTNAYAVLQRNPLLQEKAELTAALGIRSLLDQTIDQVQSYEDTAFIRKRAESVGVAGEGMHTTFCRVTDLTHPITPEGTLYILGCSGRAYPGIPQKTGLFDEDYVREISKYPSLKERHDAHLEQLAWVYEAEHIVWSYATNDYQGREIQPAYAVKSKGLSEQPWPLQKPAFRRREEHSISPSTAELLFTGEDGRISGSISRIERWFLCPYSYFLQSGLKARPEQTAEFNPATIGTLAHDYLDHLIDRQGKQYADTDMEDIRTFLEPYFSELRLLHPHDEVKNSLTEERLCIALRDSLAFLKEAEANTLYKPDSTEVPFDTDIFDGIYLHGIIDRLDRINGRFRIVDYKSSGHSLSEKKVKTGEQLQLLTYLIATAEKSGEKPDGCYYFSLQAVSSALDAASYSQKKGLEFIDEFTEDIMRASADKERRLSGWQFGETDELYTDFSVYNKKQQGDFDYELVRQCIFDLYDYFRTNVLEGTIPVDPVVGACTFCDYRSVCRNTSGERTSVPLVMQDTSLKKGKE